MHESIDGYIRISGPGGSLTRETTPTGSSLSLLFVDLDVDDETVDQVANSLQSAGCGHASVILFRWISIDGPESDNPADRAETREWLSQVAEHAVMSKHLRPEWVGVIKHVVGKPPVVQWVCCGADNVELDHPNSTALVDRALRAEIGALFDWGHAIWRPSDYHYELPSGDHSSVFVKAADAFRTPRDAMVFAAWLADRLADDQVLIVDNASLIPLVMAISVLCAQADWRLPATITLDEFPATRFSVFNALREARSLASTALILLSVNASGRHLALIENAATGILDTGNIAYEIVIIANKNLPWSHGHHLSKSGTTSWLGMADQIPNPYDSTTCSMCRSSDRPQVVKIDPRSFEALALPGANLVMPDVKAAGETKDFWTLCDHADALSVLSFPDDSPSVEARGKGEFMNVRISVQKLLKYLESDDAILRDRVFSTLKGGDDFKEVDAVIVSSYENGIPGFETFLALILQLVSKDEVPVISVDVRSSIAELPVEVREKIESTRNPLIVSVGSVSGWNLRQILVAVQQCWQELEVAGTITGLVLHSRPSSQRQWENIAASFSKRLHFLWQTFIPVTSPFDDERKVLGTVTNRKSLTDETIRFLRGRLDFCSPSEHQWDERMAAFENGQDLPDPRTVLWGLPADQSQLVRNESLYGTRVRALTAYIAVGAAMHARREKVKSTDPRWPMFDFDSISRSYFDGILVASMLRWASPSECWWGDTNHARKQSVLSLIGRTRDPGDQRVLFPELLLAAYQGKVPGEAIEDAVAKIRSDIDLWHFDIDRAPIDLAIHLAMHIVET